MPFKSKAQRRFMYAAEDRGEVPKGTARRWEDETKGPLPNRVKKRKKPMEKKAQFFKSLDPIKDGMFMKRAMTQDGQAKKLPLQPPPPQKSPSPMEQPKKLPIKPPKAEKMAEFQSAYSQPAQAAVPTAQPAAPKPPTVRPGLGTGSSISEATKVAAKGEKSMSDVWETAKRVGGSALEGAGRVVKGIPGNIDATLKRMENMSDEAKAGLVAGTGLGGAYLGTKAVGKAGRGVGRALKGSPKKVPMGALRRLALRWATRGKAG